MLVKINDIWFSSLHHQIVVAPSEEDGKMMGTDSDYFIFSPGHPGLEGQQQLVKDVTRDLSAIKTSGYT